MSGELQRLKYSHEAMAQMIVNNPTITANELAIAFRVSPAWISRVRNSCVFREHLAQLTKDVVHPVLLENLEQRFESLCMRSLEVLQEKMAQDSSKISDELALAAVGLSAKAKGLGGFGGKVAPAPAPPAGNRIEEMAGRLRNLNRTEVIDVQARNLPEAGQAGAA